MIEIHLEFEAKVVGGGHQKILNEIRAKKW